MNHDGLDDGIPSTAPPSAGAEDCDATHSTESGAGHVPSDSLDARAARVLGRAIDDRLTDRATGTQTLTWASSREQAKPILRSVPSQLGAIRLTRELGRGGMGVVWLGRDQLLDREVAVKFLLAATSGSAVSDNSRAQFLAGAGAAARVRHPAINAVLHADLIDDVPYLVMDYVNGASLAEILQATGPLPHTPAVAIVLEIAGAVEALHVASIVHRDIKPQNVLVDRDGRVSLTDFGLTLIQSLCQGAATATGLAGTPPYMAPECFKGASSARSDVYALGIMMYEALMGTVPFLGSLAELTTQHEQNPLPVALLRERDVPEAVIEVLIRATHKNATFRYKTAREFGHALKCQAMDTSDASGAARELATRLCRIDWVTDSKGRAASPAATSSSYVEFISCAAEKRREERSVTPPPVTTPQPLRSNVDDYNSLDGDLPCIGCGYNLRTASVHATCPECGRPVALSLTARRIRLWPKKELRRVLNGLHTIIFGAAFLLVGAFGLTLVSQGSFVDFGGLASAIGIFIGQITYIVGVYRLTAVVYPPMPGLGTGRRPRILAVLALAMVIPWPVIAYAIWRWLLPSASVTVMLAPLYFSVCCGLASAITLLRHVGRLFSSEPQLLPKGTMRPAEWLFWATGLTLPLALLRIEASVRDIAQIMAAMFFDGAILCFIASLVQTSVAVRHLLKQRDTLPSTACD